MKGIKIKRDVLLIQIVRHCFFPECNARVEIGLTKPEVADYRGFECTNCKQWNDDILTKHDIAEWWDDINPSKLT